MTRHLWLLTLVTVCAACAEPPATPAAREADRLWDVLQERPTPADYAAFRRNNLMAARLHGELHDRAGIEFQLRAYTAQAAEAETVADPVERARLAFEVVDGIESVERRDLLRVYEEVLPGSRARFQAALERAREHAR